MVVPWSSCSESSSHRLNWPAKSVSSVFDIHFGLSSDTLYALWNIVEEATVSTGGSCFGIASHSVTRSLFMSTGAFHMFFYCSLSITGDLCFPPFVDFLPATAATIKTLLMFTQCSSTVPSNGISSAWTSRTLTYVFLLSNEPLWGKFLPPKGNGGTLVVDIKAISHTSWSDTDIFYLIFCTAISIGA